MKYARLSLVVLFAAMSACEAGSTSDEASSTAQGASGPGPASGSTGAFMTGSGGSSTCGGCSPDLHQVLDCDGNVVQTCTGYEGCNPSTLQCANACDNAQTTKQSVGCEYYATDMDLQLGSSGYCFAAFVANTWNGPAKLDISFNGANLDETAFVRIPSGVGSAIQYQPYDAATGIPPGEVAILFLSGSAGSAPNCPVAPALDPTTTGLAGTGIGHSFQIKTDVPVVSYQINPYGGGSVAVTAGSLLLPTSAWDTNYIGVNVSEYDIDMPSMNIIAAEDNTTVKMLPVASVDGGGGIPASPANTELQFILQKGEQAQLTQQQQLTGSILQSDKPIGLMAGQRCMRAPLGTAFCDHGEQMIPPIRALGNEYVGVQYRPRWAGDAAIWRVIGAVNGTTLSYSNAVGGPATIDAGQIVTFQTTEAFVVKSQDAEHPFLLSTYMTGSQAQPEAQFNGFGDADYVISVPPAQYMGSYIFFTDPTYPVTNLVVVRSKLGDSFRDVNLDCAGPLAGWQPIGDYEYTRFDLTSGNFQGNGSCQNGRHEVRSDGPFGLWVWGWGTPETDIFTANVSYGYPGGMNVLPINEVIIPPIPR